MPGRLLLAAALAVATGGAAAHDTWFAPLGASNPNETVFALGTGNRFPVFELAVDRQYLARRGCRSADGATPPLEPLRYTDTTTLLRAASR